MKKFLSLIVAIGVSFSLVACGGSNSNNSTSTEDVSNSQTTQNKQDNSENNTQDNNGLDKISEKGYITVATSPDYPPYEFKTIENGKEKTVGFDIDIANEIAKDLGVELKLVEMGFDGLLLELQNGNVDLVMAGISPTAEREKTVDFSDIYYTATQSILVNADDVDKYTDIESFSGKKIGVQLTSIQEQMAKEQIPNANLISLDKLPQIILDLNNGNVDAVIVETPVAEGYVKQFPNLALSKVTLVDETGGSAIAIKKGNPELIEAVNKTIKRLQDDGLIEEFVVNANKLIEK